MRLPFRSWHFSHLPFVPNESELFTGSPSGGVISINSLVARICMGFNTSFAVRGKCGLVLGLPAAHLQLQRETAQCHRVAQRTITHIAFADIVPFDDPYYPASYSSAIGVYSSPNGHTAWNYHGIVLSAKAGSWSAEGVATPGAAVVRRGSAATVLVSYTAESQPAGHGTRGIGLLSATNPLGPFEEPWRRSLLLTSVLLLRLRLHWHRIAYSTSICLSCIRGRVSGSVPCPLSRLRVQ